MILQSRVPREACQSLDSQHRLAIVSQANAYFSRHYPEPLVIVDVARSLGVSEACLGFCFRHCRGKTPLEALQTYRLSQLYRAITEAPAANLLAQVLACGLPELAQTNVLFEDFFGVNLANFRHTSRRAQDDRQFRAQHPEAESLVVLASP